MPLNVSVLVLEGAGPDLEQAHGHAGADLRQLDALVAGLDKDVVADLDAVLDVLEGDDPAAEFGGGGALARREQVREDLDDALAEGRGEAVEDEVRVGLADRAARGVGDVVAQDDVVQGEARRGPVGEVRDGHGGGRASVFVQQDDIAEAGGFGRGDEVGQDQVSSVQADAGG